VTARIYVNNRIVSEDDAFISPLDRGFLYGDGLFETIKAQGDHIYFLDEHLLRLEQDARVLNLPFPADFPFRKTIRQLLQENRIQGEAAIKICLSRGKHTGMLSLYDATAPTLVIQARPYHGAAKEAWDQGLELAIERELKQNALSPLCRMKSLNYLFYLLVRNRAQAAGCDDAIIMNADGDICESTIANLFFFRRGRLETPAISCGLLPGILRAALLDCLNKAGRKAYEVSIGLDALHESEEIFLTNSLAEIIPVGKIEKHEYKGREKTREIKKFFSKHMRRQQVSALEQGDKL